MRRLDLMQAGVSDAFFDEPYISYVTDTGFTIFINDNDGSITMIIANLNSDGGIEEVNVVRTGNGSTN